MSNTNDLTGMVFGELTVLRRAGRAKDRHVIWECRCACGNLSYVNSRDLRNGHTRSCGCLQISGMQKERTEDDAGGEFTLLDRLEKIKSVISKYGEDNFFISYSGGKDSTALSAIIDMAIPHNKIPRVFSDTGIELNIVRDFVYNKQKSDERILIIKPRVPIKQMLERDGYPFKSKYHSRMVYDWWHKDEHASATKYYNDCGSGGKYCCPEALRYQFENELDFKISALCCNRLKKEPIHEWQKQHNKRYAIIGLMASEGGQRESAKCMVFDRNRLKSFQPLAPLDKAWENWFIDRYNVDICDIYKSPYNFHRSGCKGCPFVPNLQQELGVLEKFFPNERKQCEIIWAPVYAEYRRLGYRLRDHGQMSAEELRQKRKASSPQDLINRVNDETKETG